MKTMMKKVGNVFAMLIMFMCSLSSFTSCSEESTTMIFAAEYSSFSPLNVEYTDIVAAILEYQVENGLIGKDIAITKDGSDLTEEDYKNMSKEAGERILTAINAHDYNQVIRDAGISLTAPVRLSITYNVGISDMQGGVGRTYGTIVAIYELQ